MRLIELREVDSTNSYLERNAHSLEHATAVTAFSQTAGRGQRGNTWESQPGENITFSMLLRPDIEPVRQFALSEAVALQVCDVLRTMCGVECRVKWPNDIYAGADRKICGILISHSLSGRRINHSIAGIGININQRRFLSDAPNPVSVFQLTGRVHDLRPILLALVRGIETATSRLADEEYRRRLHTRYMASLWRGDGAFYPFRDTATGETFRAAVHAVEPSGHLILRTDLPDAPLRRYAFKEVSWL